MRLRVLTGFVLLSASCFSQSAPTPAPKPLAGAVVSHPDWPKAKPADVDSVEHILASLYDVISGPAHQPRDWVRMRSLFVPDARLIPVRLLPEAADKGGADVILLSIDDYIARSSGRMEADGFFERALHNDIAEFGNIVQIFSSYESKHTLSDATPFARGINSIQLLKDGGRYWIVNVFWDSERAGNPLPARYLPTTGASASNLNQNLTGEWVGQLEYRDFQTNERTFLPTWLTMTPSIDGNAVTLAYTYDDGPTKTVRETSTLTLSAQAHTASITSNRDHTSETYALAGVEEFAKVNRGTLTLTGPGKENDKPVDVRIRITLRRNLFTLEKETRPAGVGEFKFRDAYTFTRASAPAF